MAEQAEDLITTTVRVIKVNYYNDENTYAILTCDSDASRAVNKTFTVKGKVCEPPAKGMSYTIRGYRQLDKSKQQFLSIKESETTGNRTRDGWIQYLLREGPHIGEIRAEELYEAFGDSVIDAMADKAQHGRLMQLNGITSERADELHNWAVKEKHLSRVKSWLYRHGMTPALVGRIIMRFGKDTPSVVQNDTYQLMDVAGISFITADKIGKKIGIPHDNPKRILEGTMHAMRELAEEGGHTCVYGDRLTRHACEILSVSAQEVNEALKTLRSTGKLCTNHTDIKTVSKRHHLFTGEIYNAE